MVSTPQQDLLDRVEAFLVETGMAISRFGDLAVNDRSFVTDLRDGKRDVRSSTIERVDKFMDEQRQEQAA
jgi:aspartate carbamoyltransferase catalytic subunit